MLCTTWAPSSWNPSSSWDPRTTQLGCNLHGMYIKLCKHRWAQGRGSTDCWASGVCSWAGQSRAKWHHGLLALQLRSCRSGATSAANVHGTRRRFLKALREYTERQMAEVEAEAASGEQMALLQPWCTPPQRGPPNLCEVGRCSKVH